MCFGINDDWPNDRCAHAQSLFPSRVVLCQFLGGSAGTQLEGMLRQFESSIEQLTVKTEAVTRSCHTLLDGQGGATELIEPSGTVVRLGGGIGQRSHKGRCRGTGLGGFELRKVPLPARPLFARSRTCVHVHIADTRGARFIDGPHRRRVASLIGRPTYQGRSYRRDIPTRHHRSAASLSPC